jgi:hypothetical protein
MNSSSNNNNNWNDPDVFSRYGVINTDWELYKNDGVSIKELYGVSLGTKMKSHCLDVGNVIDSVMSEVDKFDKIYAYYVRNLMKGNTFISYGSSFINTNRFDGYNIDPWNRQFPYFIDNEVSDYYNSLDGSSGVSIRYGYWVFYRDRVISCSTSNNHISNRSLVNVPPLMVLTTTSLDGIIVACLDIVEW